MQRPRAIVFDLDQTLVDSRRAKPFRDQRDWGAARALIRQCALAPGALEVAALPNLKIAVVTKSPRHYAERVLRHFGIRVDVLVTYHDSPRQKPDPGPTLLALSRLCVEPGDAWVAGDHADDLRSGRAAGVTMLIGVTAWSDSPGDLMLANPSATVQHPDGLLPLLRSCQSGS